MEAGREVPRARFGSSGIRGGLDTVDVHLAHALGRVIGRDHADVVVGRDARLTGPALSRALVAGLLASGAHVHDAGIVPTPVLAFAARDHDVAIMVTASHNPAPDNGFKLITPQGTAPPPAQTQDIEAAVKAPPAPVGWDRTGTHRDAPGLAGHYMDAVLGHLAKAGFEPGSLDGQHIAIDCAHAPGALVTPAVLSRMGAGLSVLGGTLDGRFPDRPSEPTAGNLARLREIMKDGTHALGVAHDGDADRTVFVAPGGIVVRPEQLLVVLARRRRDTRIVVPVDAGGLLANALPEAQVVVTPVGDIHLSQAILDGRATLGAEPSGTWFFGDWSPAPEGPFAAAIVAAHLAHDPDLIREAIGLPVPARATKKVPLRGDAHDADWTARVQDRLTARVQAIRVTTIDGVRVDVPQGWILVRKSGTEPLVRITAEAEDEEEAARLAREGVNAVKQASRATTSGRTP